MKRITDAALAATTALSLAAVPAQAAEINGKETGGYGHKSSSQVTFPEMENYMDAATAAERDKKGEGLSAPFLGSAQSGIFETETGEEAANQGAVMNSSYRNDANRGYKLGTTYDILVGTGIAAGVLALVGAAAAAAGKIPGVPGVPAVEQFF